MTFRSSAGSLADEGATRVELSFSKTFWDGAVEFFIIFFLSLSRCLFLLCLTHTLPLHFTPEKVRG